MKRSSAPGGKDSPAKTPKKRRIPLPWVRRGPERRIYVRWRLLVVCFLIFVVVGWMAGATGLYFFIKERSGYSEVRYAHILGLPWTLKVYRQAKGEYWVTQGMAATKTGAWRDAFDLLQQGLPFVPQNEEARIMLARIYLMAGRPDMARPVLIEGLKYNSDQTEYLRTVFGFLFGQQADEAVVEVANNLLTPGGVAGDTRRMLAIARVYAYFNRDQFAAARSALATEGLAGSPEGQFIEARIAWETGLRESALVQLRSLHARAPQDGEIYRTLIFYLKEAKLLDEARRVALARQFTQPDSPDAYVDFISLCAEDGLTERQAEAEADFLRHFSGDTAALLKLATWAASKGQSALAWRLVELCRVKPTDLHASTILALEADLNAGAFGDAAKKLSEAGKLPLNESQRATLLGLETVALYGAGQDAEGLGAMNRLLSRPAVPTAALAGVGKHLRGLGKLDAAGRVLHRAVELDPLYQPALVELLRLELQQRNLDSSLELVGRLPTMRKPPSDLLVALADNLESDRYLFVAPRKEIIGSLRTRLAATSGAPQT